MSTARSFAVYRSLEEVPRGQGRSVVTIGNFDGVHCGHRSILNAVVEDARTRGARAVAVTFDPHPEQFLRPAEAGKLITPLEEKLRLLAATGIDAVLVIPFNAEFAARTASTFVERVLAETLHACAVHEGANFRFGVRAEAGIGELARFGETHGFALAVHGGVCVHGIEVSSTAIRAFVAAGDVKRARWLLGRPFSILSTQQRDRGVGSTVLVPTINFARYDELLPANGVYVSRLAIGGRSFDGVTNVGTRPTFEGAGFSVETHLLNFEPIDVSADSVMELTFLYRLRAEMKWPSPEALKAQIMRDVAKAKRYLRRGGVGSRE